MASRRAPIGVRVWLSTPKSVIPTLPLAVAVSSRLRSVKGSILRKRSLSMRESVVMCDVLVWPVRSR